MIIGVAMVSPNIIASAPLKSNTLEFVNSNTKEPYSGLKKSFFCNSSFNFTPIKLPNDILLIASAIPPLLTVCAETQTPF